MEQTLLSHFIKAYDIKFNHEKRFKTPSQRSHSALPALFILDLTFALLPPFNICIAPRPNHKIEKMEAEMESVTKKMTAERQRGHRASYVHTSRRKAKEVMMEPFRKKWGSSYLASAVLDVGGEATKTAS